ncbi:hypothetical protein KUTeg_011837 [Tegillarca granosa]|uniref:EF-hand domain-containing protein n=1 Tax=Tegillarca granosa TaxID=220873 RepID=A0ABQ9F264_TEGGR|nr:hypothetical protein KUTeg_011837 [Tegillarca granosa]
MALAKAFKGESEMIEVKKAFSKYDENGDMKISIREAKNVLKDMGYKNPTVDDVKKWMKEAGDKDLADESGHERAEEMAKELIDEADEDGNGEIDYKEFKHIFFGKDDERH